MTANIAYFVQITRDNEMPPVAILGAYETYALANAVAEGVIFAQERAKETGEVAYYDDHMMHLNVDGADVEVVGVIASASC